MKSKVIYMILYGLFVCLVFASPLRAAVMKKNWINVHKVMLENETVQNQKYAELITNAVEVGVNTLVSGGSNAWWVYIPLNVKTIDAVQLGYLYKPSSGIVSQIDQINIIKVAAPGKQGDTVCEAKSLALNSAVYTFHKISTPHLFAKEGFLLAVKIIFKNHQDRFIIGPVGIEEYGSAIGEVNPVDFGAVGDGKADETRKRSKMLSTTQSGIKFHLI